MAKWITFMFGCLLDLLGPPAFSHECPMCNAEGRLDGGWCPECDGKRWLRTPKEQQYDEWNRS